jgi:membrane fusion protein (multidrug efflux system)
MKKRIILILVIVGIIVVLALPKIFGEKKNVAGAAGKPQAKVITVTVHEVGKEILDNSMQVAGNVLAMEEINLVSETSGRITKIGFTEGTEVKKGDLLLKINDADLQAQLKKAQSTLKLRIDSETRNKQLLEKGAISQETYDITATDLNTSQADIDLIKEQIRKTEIIAPFNGVIGLRYVSEGGYVTSNTAIASLQQLNEVKVEFSVPEKYASKVKKGGTITFKVDGDETNYSAIIYAIEPQVDAATRNVVMRAKCSNPNRKLLPGAFAKVAVHFGDEGQVLTIPTQSVIPILKGQKVFIMQGDSAVERVIITGKRAEKVIEVKNGLQEGDKVIVNGVMYLKPGSKVKL